MMRIGGIEMLGLFSIESEAIYAEGHLHWRRAIWRP